MSNSRKTVLITSLIFFAFCQCSKEPTRYSRKRNKVERYQQLNDTTLAIAGIANDANYGYTQHKPIMLGLYDIHKAASNVEKYLNALQGPNGEVVNYLRLKACCPFKTKNFRFSIPILGQKFDGKHGMLERYQVQYGDSTNKISTILYINLYDETKTLLAPKGFTYKAN